MSARTLYASEDRSRFFLVPNDAKLAKGDFVVRSILGATLAVDPMVVDLYEVSEAEGQEAIRTLLLGLGSKIAAIAGSAAKALQEAPRLDPEEVAAREARVAESLRVTREELKGDPKAVVSAVGALLAGVLQAAKDSVNAPETAEARIRDVAEALRQEGADEEAVDAVEALPARLRELLGSDETKRKVEELTEKIRKATRDLEGS